MKHLHLLEGIVLIKIKGHEHDSKGPRDTYRSTRLGAAISGNVN